MINFIIGIMVLFFIITIVRFIFFVFDDEDEYKCNAGMTDDELRERNEKK
jgi:hypothetical protein